MGRETSAGYNIILFSSVFVLLLCAASKDLHVLRFMFKMLWILNSVFNKECEDGHPESAERYQSAWSLKTSARYCEFVN